MAVWLVYYDYCHPENVYSEGRLKTLHLTLSRKDLPFLKYPSVGLDLKRIFLSLAASVEDSMFVQNVC